MGFCWFKDFNGHNGSKRWLKGYIRKTCRRCGCAYTVKNMQVHARTERHRACRRRKKGLGCLTKCCMHMSFSKVCVQDGWGPMKVLITSHNRVHQVTQTDEEERKDMFIKATCFVGDHIPFLASQAHFFRWLSPFLDRLSHHVLLCVGSKAIFGWVSSPCIIMCHKILGTIFL